MSEPISDDGEALKVAHSIIKAQYEIISGYFYRRSAGFSEASETLQGQIPRLNAYLADEQWGDLE